MKIILPICLLLTLLFAAMYFLITPAAPASYFGRALFGTDSANPDAWVHFIVQGNQTFVDLNKDDLAQTDEKFDPSDGLSLTIDQRRFQIVSASPGINAEAVTDALPQRLQLQVDILDSRAYTMAGKILLTQSPERSNWIQFGGKLQFMVMDQPQLRAGSKTPGELKIFIGTPAETVEGSPTQVSQPVAFRTAIVIPSHNPPFPTVDINYNRTDSDSKSERLIMNEFC